MFQHLRALLRPTVPTSSLGALTILLLFAGCGGPHRVPTPTSDLPSIPGYEGLQEDLRGRDLTPLRHRRIVLDPGHGGYFRGALGPNGLTEAEVNLGVALNLRGLLEWAGAEVWLTRTADTDFLSPSDSLLSSDLAMRVSLSDSLQPDVFLSLHHNSTASLDRTINETQTYYPLDGEGASLDLARAIHRHLVINLGIQPASIRPGNFHVLRNATVPAVLGEPAMISHPVMAQRLSLAASQRLEAEAYFLGLLDYFQGGLPIWSGAACDTVYWGEAEDPKTISWQFLAAGAATDSLLKPAPTAPGPDPSQTQLTLNGQPVTTQLSPDARTVTWTLPHDLPPTTHVLEVHGRNLAGRATPRRRTVLLPRTAPTLHVTMTREATSGRAVLHWRGLGGAPLPEGTLTISSGHQFPIGPDYADWVLIEDLLPSPDALTAELQLKPVLNPPVTCGLTVTQLPTGQQLRLITATGQPFAPATGWRSRLGANGTSPMVTVDNEEPIWLEGAGVQPLLDPAPAEAATMRTVAGAASHWEAVPILPGLMKRVIVLDPAGGGTMTDGAGPLGLRGADLNLAVAQHAALLLRGAGAEVHLTREDETALRPVEKVRLAGQVGADFFLTIGRRTPNVVRTIRHHPGSTVGIRWAAAAAQACALLPRPDGAKADSAVIETSSHYLLRHTAAPALQWQFDLPLTSADEMRQIQPGWHRAEGRAIFLAIAAVSGQPDVFANLISPTAILARLENHGGLPATNVDWLQIDGNLPWTPLPHTSTVAGTANSVASSDGPGLPALLSRIVVETHAGPQWQVWLLDRTDTDWQPTLLLDGNRQQP